MDTDHRHLRRSSGPASASLLFQQLVGINVVFYYGAVLWKRRGFTEDDALQINVLSGGRGRSRRVFATSSVDRIGRKPLLLVGSAGMAVTLGVVA